MHFNKKCRLVFLLCFCVGIFYSQNAKDSLEECTFSCCSVTDPTPAGVMISHTHTKNQWMFSYRYMNSVGGNVLQGTTKMTANDVYVNYLMSPDKMQMDMHMLMAMYGITNKLTVMAMMNYNVMNMNMTMLPIAGMNMPGMENTQSGNMSGKMKTSGTGDLKINFLYGLLNKKNHHLLVSGGVSIPTGSVELKGSSTSMYPNQRLPFSMQMGSGTFDVLPCVNYLFQQNKITFSSQISSVIRTGTNSVGYRLGNEVTLNNWFAFQWSRFFSSSLRVEGNVSGIIKGNDPTLYYGYEPAANPNNYGGTRANIFLGTSFHFVNGFLKKSRLGVEYGLPVYQNLNGIQMSMKSSLYASMTVSF